MSWSDPLLPLGALAPEMVLEYFSYSPFYDRTCLNEHLKMQNMPAQDAARLLARLPGVIYQLQEPLPEGKANQLYVIRKFSRGMQAGGGGAAETTLRYYYVLDNVIYEAPTLAAVVRARLQRLGWYLSGAFDLVSRSDPARAGSAAAERAGGAEASRAADSAAGAPARPDGDVTDMQL